MPWLVLIGILVAALSLRSPIIAVTPVLSDIIADLGISAAAAGMLTTAPLLMFAAFTPMAALVIRRAGAEATLLVSLAGVLVGTFIRAAPGYGAMLTGMFVIGAAITLGNVVVPVLIRRDLPPEKVAMATAAYGATLNVGSLLAALGTVPLAQATGWPLAILLWAVLTVAGIVLWLVHMARSGGWRSRERMSGEQAPRSRGGTPSAETSSLDAITGPMPVVVDNRVGAVLRRPIVWMLLVAFAAQSAVYYAMSTWLPTILLDTTDVDAAGAGALASIFQGVAIGGALLAPVLLRVLGPIASGALMGACFATMVVGMLVAPELAALWAASGAIAHAAGFVLIFTAMVRVSRSDSEAATMSAFVQGCGYLVAASAAPAIGAVHEAAGGWQVPLTLVLGLTVVYAVVLTAAMTVAFRRR